MYGAFGRDFPTADGRRVMVVAISQRQWQSLVDAVEIGEHLEAIERAFRVDLRLEGDRFRARDALAALIAPWVAARTLPEIADVFDRLGVCWGAYQTFAQLLHEDWRVSDANPVFRDIDQPGIGKVRVGGSPLSFGAIPRDDPRPAPQLGQHSEEILAEDLGLSAGEIAGLRDRRIIVGPA
jgi:2-methylfumaryl-CoA isomerase